MPWAASFARFSAAWMPSGGDRYRHELFVDMAILDLQRAAEFADIDLTMEDAPPSPEEAAAQCELRLHVAP